MDITHIVTVQCREPFETVTDGRSHTRIRVEEYRVMPVGPYGHGKFSVSGTGPVLTKTGAVHKGRNRAGKLLEVHAVPEYVYAEALEKFEDIAAQAASTYAEYIAKIKAML